MDDRDHEYLVGQLALFRGGYEWIHITFDVHLAGPHDEIQIGYTITDGYTGQWIAADVPTALLRLADVDRAANHLAEIIEAARNEISPFPG